MAKTTERTASLNITPSSLNSFSWTRNGTHFDVEKDSKVVMKPGSGTLVIDISGEKAEAYEGTYQCTAHNEHGTALSNKIVIRQSSKAFGSVALRGRCSCLDNIV